MAKIVQNAGNLSAAQRAALAALASGASKKQAGIIANRSERTVNRWLAEDERFQEAVKQTTNQAIDDASRRLAGMLDDAIEVITGVMGDGTISAHIRLRAAEIVLSHAVRMIEFQQLEERIKVLEERLNHAQT